MKKEKENRVPSALVTREIGITYSKSQNIYISMLKEKPLPKHSHTIPGVAHTPPESVTAGTGVPSQRATPVS